MIRGCAFVSLGLVLAASMLFAGPVRADDAVINTTFEGLGPEVVAQFTHEDAEPFKGTVTVNLQNTGTEPWGDFHFEIFGIPGFPSVQNLDFVVTSPYQPTGTQSGMTWTVDNVSVGAKLDLFFYGDPVMPGETAQFAVYTNNVDHVTFFGVAVYPTPLPEPATLVLMTLGGLLTFRRRR